MPRVELVILIRLVVLARRVLMRLGVLVKRVFVELVVLNRLVSRGSK